jgi:mono/diheme cytochrome c family protein/plastocyanin
MKKGLREFLATVVTIALLIALPVVIFQNRPGVTKGATPVVRLTGVMKDGVWTDEDVNGLNYWWKTFRPATSVLRQGEEVLLRLSSSDGTHSFYVPELNLGPIQVVSGHTVDVRLRADKPGSYTYYCTLVCGDRHYFMRGTIRVLAANEQIASYVEPAELPYPFYDPPKSFSSAAERGKYLYKRKGCVTCHGEDGKGGVYNPNYVSKFVPRLDNLADKMKIYSEEDAEMIMKLLESNTDLESLEDDPPVDGYSRFLAQHHSVQNKILNGSPLLQMLNPDGPKPPLTMPAWEEQLSTEDINAILVYLISQFPWEEYE